MSVKTITWVYGSGKPAFQELRFTVRADVAPVLKGVKRLVAALPQAAAQRPDIDTITPEPT